MRTIGTALLTMILLSSCSLVPDYTTPQVITADSWSSEDVSPSTAGVELHDWWRVFHNEVLTRYISEALQNNAQMQAGLFRVEASRAQAKIAGAPLLPSLEAGAGGIRSSTSGDSQGVGDRNNFDTTGTVAYEIDLWGKNRAARNSARSLAQASVFEFGALALVVSSDTAQAYLAFLALTDRINVSASNIRNLEEVLKLVQVKTELGALTPFELAQQRTLLYSSTAALLLLKRQRQGVINQLAVLLGKPPDMLGIESGGLSSISVPELRQTLPSEVIQSRPDIRASEAMLIAAHYDIGVARAAYFPRLDLAAALSLTAPDISGPSSTSSIVSGALAAPIFRGGALEGGVEKARARASELTEQYRQTVLVALREVEDALVGLSRGKDRRDELRKGEEEARKAYGIARQRFSLGSIEFLQLLDTERALLLVQDSYIQAQLEYISSAIALCKALGGGWEKWIFQAIGPEHSRVLEGVAQGITKPVSP